MDQEVIVTGIVKAERPGEVLRPFKKIPGKQHMHNNVELEPEDVILLNPGQAKSFADKLQPVGEFKAMTGKEITDFETKEAQKRAERLNKKLNASVSDKAQSAKSKSDELTKGDPTREEPKVLR